ncbi:hypothetical protein ACSQ6I_07270 [Anabaena sp. WFMT]|uniref:hypothetical protein n=1 Tax=Anabaena sp. WFMT TaxID=3449730 RepID=UPI003F20E64D
MVLADFEYQRLSRFFNKVKEYTSVNNLNCCQNDVNLALGTILKISSQYHWNMNNPNSDANLDIDQIIEQIADVSYKIANGIKNKCGSREEFEKTTEDLKLKSALEQQQYQEEFDERKRQIRDKFRKRRY